MAGRDHGARKYVGPIALAPWPDGTLKLSVSRQVSESHQRGGRRQHLGCTTPQEVEAFVSAQGPGRYRVACIGPGGQNLPDGVFAVEIGLDSPQPQVVRPRTPADYGAPGSPLAAAHRKERQAVERVQALREKVRVVERENARLRAEIGAKEERALAERHHTDEDHGRLHAEVQRLAREVADLRAELERRDNVMPAYVEAEVGNHVATEEASRAEISPGQGTSMEAGKRATTASCATHRGGAGEIDGEGHGAAGNPARHRDGRDRGFSALASVRNVASEGEPKTAGSSQGSALGSGSSGSPRRPTGGGR